MDMILKEMTNACFSKYDLEAAKILDSFLPHRIFDAHMHISHCPVGNSENITLDRYYKDMAPYLFGRQLSCNAIIFPVKTLLDKEELKRSDEFLISELNTYGQNVGEIMVFPTDTVEDIEKRLTHPGIRGLKCYHIYSSREVTFDSYIDEYLPESAWEVANKHKLFITLHMVRNKALADEGNLKYIKEMAKKYPDATLILAHAARAFAAWTAFDTVDQLVGYDNIWYDFAGVCESPAMLHIIKKIGIKRCMWGTDYNVSMLAGKPISIGDTFYWISEADLRQFASATEFHSWLVGTENLMATRQACMLADLSDDAVEDLFYNNAAALMGRK